MRDLTHLTYTGLRGGLEHLKIETRFTDERFESVMGDELFVYYETIKRKSNKRLTYECHCDERLIKSKHKDLHVSYTLQTLGCG
jgi:hypothetical protein